MAGSVGIIEIGIGSGMERGIGDESGSGMAVGRDNVVGTSGSPSMRPGYRLHGWVSFVSTKMTWYDDITL